MAQAEITKTKVSQILRRTAYDLLGDDQEVADVFNVKRTAIVNWRQRHGIESQKPRSRQ